MQRIFYKTPAEVDYVELDYQSSLANDVIETSSWQTTDPAMTVDMPPPSFDALVTRAWLASGTLNSCSTPAYVTNTAQTVAGRLLQNAIKIIVRPFNFIDEFSVKMPFRFMAAQIADYTLDWTKRLLDGADTIVTSSWASSSNGLRVDAVLPFIGTPKITTTVWLTGTQVGSYIITNTVVTRLGRTLQMSFLVTVRPFVITTST